MAPMREPFWINRPMKSFSFGDFLFSGVEILAAAKCRGVMPVLSEMVDLAP